jgi:hypothetical protein
MAADSVRSLGLLSYLHQDRRAALRHIVEYVMLEDGGHELTASLPRNLLSRVKGGNFVAT